MIVPPYITRVIDRWNAWRVQQRLYRAFPELRDLDQQERAARAAHRPVRQFQRQRQGIISAQLQREVRHG
jgi:hypothetical protein